MSKQLCSLLLVLALLLGATSGLAEQTASLSSAEISSLRRLAGENGGQWREGTPPSPGMNAFQIGQWADWFLANRVRSLLGAIQDDAQMAPGNPLNAQEAADQQLLREMESTLARCEAQLEEDRLAILNGIRLIESGAAEDDAALAACARIREAKDRINQIIRTLCAEYGTYAAQVDACLSRLQAHYSGATDAVHDAALGTLASSAQALEASESSASLHVSVTSTHQLRIRVCDAAGAPITGATVTLTTPGSARVQAATDGQGDAVFWAGDLGADEAGALRLGLRVEARGYRTREVQTERLCAGETRRIDLEEDDGSPYLIMGCFDGRDVLTESLTCYSTKQNTAAHAFTAKLHCSRDGVLELHYLTDAGQDRIVSRAFTAADSDSTVLTFEDQWLSLLPPGSQVSFTIRAGGDTYAIPARLVIQKAMVDAPFLSRSTLLPSAGSSALSIPAGIPFIGGKRLSVGLPLTLPRALYLPSHRVLFALGDDFMAEQALWQTRDAEDEARAVKQFELRGKADGALAEASAHRSINTATQSALLGGHSAYVTPFAALQGLYRTGEQAIELRGTAGATMAFDADITQAFTSGSASFLAGAHLDMAAGFSRDVASSAGLEVTAGLPRVTAGPQLRCEGEADVPLTLDMRLASGISDSDGTSVDLRGYGRLSPIVRFAASGVTAGAGMDAGLDVTLRTLFLKRILALRAAKPDLAQPSAPNVSTAEESRQMDRTGVRIPVPSTSGISYGRGGVEPAETRQLLRQLDNAADGLQLVQIGTDTYAFWIQLSPDQNQATRLRWQCLSNPDISGGISFLNGTSSNFQRNSYTDYAFAVEVSGDLCALTILSGNFPEGGGEEPVPPSEACVATVLIQRDDGQGRNGSLDLIGYRETVVRCEPGEDYPILPGVRLIENNGALSVLSTYSMHASPHRIDGQLLAYDDSHQDLYGKGLKQTLSLECADDARINRYCIAKTPSTDQDSAFYTLDEKGELSRLRGSRARSTEVLARGDIVSFRVLSDSSGERLFYLERAKAQSGATVHRLRSVVPGTGTQTDYGIETAASSFDIVRLGEGVYLYWTECSTPDDPESPGEISKAYLVRCVRYDPGTDTAYGPFSLAELSESPNFLKLMSAGTGFYTVDLQNAAGSYQRISLSQFTCDLIASAALTAAVLPDPCVSAGDCTDLVLTVKNTGNVPLSALDVRIVDTETGALVQTLHIDLEHPEAGTTSRQAGHAVHTLAGEDAVRRIDSLYDPLNQEAWTITDKTAAGSRARSVRTSLLMPGDTRSYQAGLQIPANWAGRRTLVAQIIDMTAEAALSGRREAETLILTGASPAGGTAQSAPVYRLGSDAAMKIDTDASDLMLSTQLLRRSGEDYVHITLRNRSGSASAVAPALTATFRGKTLYSHAFGNPLGDDFGYSMDIPLSTLTNGRTLPELELHAGSSSGAAYGEYADSDNHVRLLLTTQLCITRQPQSIPASVGKPAQFSVTAAGGQTPYRYQWQRMVGPNRWENIPGAKQDTYRIASVKDDQNGLTVRCVVTDQFGDSVTSDPATLTILPQTGDRSQLALWILVALASLAGLVLVYRKARSR